MITSLMITNPRVPDSSLYLVSMNVNTDPIQIRNISGLGPVEATINTTRFGSVDGEYYQGSSVGKRNIVITVGLSPNWITQTVSSLRKLLYSYFMPKSSVNLYLSSDDMEDVKISGYVESMEPSIFSKDPEVQISIICAQPYFEGATTRTETGTSTNMSGAYSKLFTYTGSVPTGFTVKLERDSADYNAGIELLNTNWDSVDQARLFLDPVNLTTTKYLEVSTHQGLKYARAKFTNGGADINILGSLRPGSSWPMVYNGKNYFGIRTTVAGFPWTITYKNRYGGL